MDSHTLKVATRERIAERQAAIDYIQTIERPAAIRAKAITRWSREIERCEAIVQALEMRIRDGKTATTETEYTIEVDGNPIACELHPSVESVRLELKRIRSAWRRKGHYVEVTATNSDETIEL
jgi:hypothetical protein